MSRQRAPFRGSTVSVDPAPASILTSLRLAGIDLIVVGGMAAVMLGAPVVTQDLDIVHRRTDENVDRLMAWLREHGAYHRFDLASRKLPPARDLLMGGGHVNLQTDLGPLDVLCELGPGEGYEELLGDTVGLSDGTVDVRVLGLARLIVVKARAGRPKDRAVLPVLLATLDEQQRAKR
jgi:hypothetical protein